jgi:hypothetical protein
VYAAKYPRHTDSVRRTIKQAIDARYVAERGGVSSGVAVGPKPGTIGGELGLFYFPNASVEGRVGAVGLLGTGDQNAFGGFTAGLRTQLPSRLAPFTGAGVLAATGKRSLESDRLDNDHDLLIDESDEEEIESYFAVFPEAGVHFWLTPYWRLTAAASYHVTSSGRDDDQWLFGIGLSLLNPEPPYKLPLGEPELRRLPPTDAEFLQ